MDWVFESFGGLRGGSRRKGRECILQGGKPGSEAQLFMLGMPKPNRFGGLFAWARSRAGTVYKAELLVLNHKLKKKLESLSEDELTVLKLTTNSSSSGLKSDRSFYNPFQFLKTFVLVLLGFNSTYDAADEEEEEFSDDEEEEAAKSKEQAAIAKRKAVLQKQKGAEKGKRVARSIAAKALKVNEVAADDTTARQIYKDYTITRLRNVPAACLIRQADGSVGFFVQPQEKSKHAEQRDAKQSMTR